MSTENTIRIKGSITSEVNIKGRISAGNAVIPSYTGLYAVQPDSVGTVLETKNKRMIDNVIINPIRYTETANATGTTVTIG